MKLYMLVSTYAHDLVGLRRLVQCGVGVSGNCVVPKWGGTKDRVVGRHVARPKIRSAVFTFFFPEHGWGLQSAVMASLYGTRVAKQTTHTKRTNAHTGRSCVTYDCRNTDHEDANQFIVGNSLKELYNEILL